MGAGMGSAMVFVLFTYGGWNDAAYISAEVRDREKNMARALLFLDRIGHRALRAGQHRLLEGAGLHRDDALGCGRGGSPEERAGNDRRKTHFVS